MAVTGAQVAVRSKRTIEANWTCEGLPSKCENHIIPGKEILNNAGVRSTMGLTSYTSKEDFIINQDKFVDVIVAARSVTGQGINSSHVVLINVCYGVCVSERVCVCVCVMSRSHV